MNHDGVIGVGNDLPWRLPTDLRFFRQTTIGGTVLMGRRTFDSLNKRPLKGRYNIVLSHNSALLIDPSQGKFACGVLEALAIADQEGCGDCFVVGGASVYRQLHPFVDTYLVTLVDKCVTNADTYIVPNELFGGNSWEILGSRSYDRTDSGEEANFTIFELRARDADQIVATRLNKVSQYVEDAKGRSLPRAPVRRQRFSGMPAPAVML